MRNFGIFPHKGKFKKKKMSKNMAMLFQLVSKQNESTKNFPNFFLRLNSRIKFLRISLQIEKYFYIKREEKRNTLLQVVFETMLPPALLLQLTRRAKLIKFNFHQLHFLFTSNSVIKKKEKIRNISLNMKKTWLD